MAFIKSLISTQDEETRADLEYISYIRQAKSKRVAVEPTSVKRVLLRRKTNFKLGARPKQTQADRRVMRDVANTCEVDRAYIVDASLNNVQCAQELVKIRLARQLAEIDTAITEFQILLHAMKHAEKTRAKSRQARHEKRAAARKLKIVC